MKIKKMRFSFTKKSILLILFFSCMFVFASFTKEDRQKVRKWKKDLVANTNKEDIVSTTNDLDKIISTKRNTVGEKDGLLSSYPQKNEFKEPDLEHNSLELQNSWTNSNSFSAKEKEGTIGVLSDREEDQTSDNFFTIDLPSVNSENTSAYMEYDLFGLANHQSVSRSINHNLAIGGEIIVPRGEWSHQREELNSGLLKNGINTVLFTSPSQGIKYKVKNLKIVFEKKKKELDRPFVNSIISENQLYVKGFSRSKDLNVNNIHIDTNNGEFEKLIQLSEKEKLNGNFSIEEDGKSFFYKIPENAKSYKVIKSGYFNSKNILISNDRDFDIKYEDIAIKIEKETSESANINILKLREKDIPSVSNGLKNVTLNNSAYRISLLSGKLNKKIKISIPYDEKRLGQISPKEIKVFSFDYNKKQWKVETSAVVNEENKSITFEGDGDGDYINGIISTPEAPQLNASNPTGISGLKAVNPSVIRNFIEPPTANQKGSANISYPIVIPAGRNGMQPNISIGYDSNKANGWMGEGWDVNGLSSISLDTRWGAPRFDPNDETELYALDGTMLVYDNSYLPHRHNDINEHSTVFTTDKQKRSDFLLDNKKTFFLRKNHNFSKIERYGSSPLDYRWIVTTTSGRKIYYGGNESYVNEQSVIKDEAGNIIHWAVWQEMDANNNIIEYQYENLTITGQSGVNENLNGGKYFHINKITYTIGKRFSPNTVYTVEFEKESSIIRQDISINAKRGVKEIEPYRLNKIYVKYGYELIRTYSFSYKEGEFYKTLLTGFKHTDNSPDQSYNNTTTDEYRFDYYNDIKDNQTNSYTNFAADTNVNASIANAFPILPDFLTPSKINANSTIEWGVNGRVGVGLNFLLATQDPYGHAMISGMLGYSQAEAKNAQQLIDFNGDGIQDIIYRRPNVGLFVSTGSISQNGTLTFADPKPILNLNSNFSYTKTKTDNKGYDFGLKVFGLGYNRSFVWSTTRSTTSTFLTDANSDGLIDVVKDGEVWFNRVNQDGKNEMTNFSDTTENMVLVADDALQNNDNESGLDVVKFWIAPKDGQIRFKDNISIENVPNAKAVYSVEMLNPGSTTPINSRIYLKVLTPSVPAQNINITRYNSYYNDIKDIAPIEANNHLATNNRAYLNVKSGDKVFIRLHKNNNKDFKVYSNPQIDYVTSVFGSVVIKPVINTEAYSQDGFYENNGSYSDNYFLNNGLNDLSFDNPGTVTINIPSVTFPQSNDAISFKVIKQDVNSGSETVIYPTPSTPAFPQNNGSFVTPAHTITESIISGQPVKIKFKVESNTHRSFKQANWNNISVNYQTNISGNSNPINVKGIPEYPSYFITDFTEKLSLSNYYTETSSSNQYYINFSKNLPVSGLKGRFVYIIKKGNTVLAKRRVEVDFLSSPYVVEYDLLSNQTLPNFAPVLIYNGTLQQAITVDELVSIQVYCDTVSDEGFYKTYRSHFQNKPFYITLNDSTAKSNSFAATSLNSSSMNPYSFIYNNYGQFLYDQSSDMIFDKIANEYVSNPNTPADYFGRVINPTLVQGMNTPPIGNLASCVNLPTQAEVEQCIQQNSGPYNSPNVGAPPIIFPLYPFKNSNNIEKWMGKGLPEQYAMADSFKDDDSVSSLFSTAGIDPEIIDMPVQGDVDTKMYAINKRYYSKSKTKTVSGSLVVVNLSNSESHLEGDKSIMTQDFIDMNGDGYPDIVYKDSAQLTNATGGLGKGAGVNPNNHSPYINNYLSKSDNYQNSNAKGFSISGFKTAGRILFGGQSTTTTQADTSTPWADPGASITIFKDPSKDEGMEYWMDINGDGLVDRFNGAGFYSLNMGYKLNAGESYSGLASYSSKPVGAAGIDINMSLISGGMDYNSGMSMGFGVSANVGVSASMGTAERVYEDINSDGLIDILYVEGNSTKVSYNLGNRFAPAVALFKNSSGNIDFNNEAKTYNGGFSLNGHFYINIPICCIFVPLLYLKIGAQASGNVGISISEVDKAFKDMNGDGFPDLVVSHDGGFTVNYSKIGKTNKLKTVTNYFSKSPVNIFEINYSFTKPTYDDPNGRLVMTETKVLNPDIYSNNYMASTPGKDIVNTFSYEKSKYDRRERDFFGFETVTSNEMEGSNIYRSIKNTYYNKGYFLNGILKKTESFIGNSQLTSSTENFYKLYKFKDNNTKINLATVLPESFDTGGREGRKMATVLLDQTKTRVFDNGGSIETLVNSTYNEKGQLIKYQYQSPSSAYNSVIEYHDPTANNVLNIPKTIKVFQGTSSSNPIRQRKTEISTTGLITKVSVQLNDTEFAVTDMVYDLYGNLSKITYPSNKNGERYSIKYTYDSSLSKYVVQSEDSFGYQSMAQYDKRFDVITQATDISGNVTDYEYDAKGRLTKILAPKEKEQGAPYTIKYSYYIYEGHQNYYNVPNNKFFGVTQHYNYYDSTNPIETIAIADGWGQVVQTKKDIALNNEEKMSISGPAIKDIHGRVIKQYHPTFEDKMASTSPNSNLKITLDPFSDYFTTATYDARDRVVSTTDELLHTTNNTYEIENNLIKSTVTLMQNNANEIKSETFVNAEGKTVKSTNHIPGQALDTRFLYNNIGELQSVIDPEGITTTYGYDMAGRKISQIHPDRGGSYFTYDEASNLTRSTNGNLLAGPMQQYIQYNYEYNRLSEIKLPDTPGGNPNPANVLYQYGAAGSGNDAGKLISKTDNSGVTEYEYGNMGEVITENKQISGYNIPGMTFTTKYLYDSWNRILNIIYPDNESVEYEYDFGGNLMKIYAKEYEYIKDIQYDHYEQRTSLTNGNDMKSEFTYSPADRKLQSHILSDGNGVELLKNTYAYDFVGNITGLENIASAYYGMGGKYQFKYGYDRLNRLTSSEGLFNGDVGVFSIDKAKFTLGVNYNETGGIIYKNQDHTQNGTQNALNSYSNEYNYINGTHKVGSIINAFTNEQEYFEYDLNGNLIADDKNGEVDHMLWDDVDRLKAVYKKSAGVFQYYVYDDQGERIIKYNLQEVPQLYQNGVLIEGGSMAIDSYKIYPNAYVTYDANNILTKHYYAGSQRVASRVADAGFTATKQQQSDTSKSADKKEQAEPEKDFKIYLEKAGIDFENLTLELSKNAASEPNVYYLHGDHLGTANFVTEQHGKATQFFLNLPFGETMAEQMIGIYDNPYKFNAKELDSETGLYYYGARYYNPRLSIWYGVDPLAEKYQDWNPYVYTFQNPIKYIDPNGMEPIQGPGDDLDAYIRSKGGVNAFGPQKPRFTKNDWQNNFEQWNYKNEVTAWNKLSYAEKSQKARLSAGLQILNAAFKQDAETMADLFEIQSYLGGSGMASGRVNSFFKVWETKTDNNFVGSLATKLGKVVENVDQPFSFSGGMGDVDIVTKAYNIEVKSGNKMKLSQSLKNQSYAESQGKDYILYMPKATKKQVYDAGKKGINVVNNFKTLQKTIK
ncbi:MULTISPECIES: RHS repeat-associated core domain-containing protein [unclassified Chryseobacterium]|uniref:RHS repeat-associated core domain-containing protein n=1 Tax=unclassified Chryseobacterium TaxID=2593645 RepID=UPI00226A8CF5|nr:MULTISPECIES: RHS repeat-associated core domain-containing protein [unclassified Chryseobacterium]